MAQTGKRRKRLNRNRSSWSFFWNCHKCTKWKALALSGYVYDKNNNCLGLPISYLKKLGFSVK